MVGDVREAIISYQHSERLKSELIIASQLIGEVEGVEGNEVRVAARMVSSFLEAILGETRISYNVLNSTILLEADRKIVESIRNIELADYAHANRCIAEAISAVTTLSNDALQFLIDQGLMK